MEVETQKPPTGELWTRWEGQSVNGAFPLRRCLGSSDHSGVFLTGYAEQNLPNVALKLVPAIPTLAESQLSHWGAAAKLEHPNLIRLFETGRCQLGPSHYLYVVMDYAEQNLAQLLQHRALTEAEVREMLPLTLEALAFLHARDMVQGQLKPSNVLVVDNRLALASDTIRPADEATASIGMLSIHNPPEARDGSFSTAGDVWALGVTLCQALTQRTPLQSSERRDLVVLPPDIPPAFNDVLRRCLARNPAQRPSIVDLQEWLARGTLPAAQPVKAPAAATSAPPAVAAKVEPNYAPTRLVIRAVIDSVPPAQPAVERRSVVPWILGAVAVVAVGWGGLSWFRGASHTNTEAAGQGSAAVSQEPGAVADRQAADTQAAPPGKQGMGSTAAPAEGSTPPATASAPATTSGPSTASAPATAPTPSTASSAHSSGSTRHSRSSGATASVVHEDTPSVPAQARATIHGHVKVTVRVTIDGSGVVVSDTLVRPGPSRYFARLASESARRWRFAPTGTLESRQSQIRFDFARSGTKVSVDSP